MKHKIVAGLLGLLCGCSLFAQTTYRSIPLDCGGYLSGFAIHSSGRLYAFGDVFGMWRSDNAGQSWQYLEGDFTTFDYFINGCAVAAGSADTVAFLSSGSVWKSTDGGTNWANLLTNLSPRRDRGATPLIFHPGNDSELWLASARSGLTGTLWRSVDGGANWAKMGGTAFDAATATTVYVRPEFPNQIWVGAVGGLFVSTNRGTNFTLVWSNVGGVPPYGSVSLTPTVNAIARRSDGIGYIATDTKGWRITASDYNNPATYTATATVAYFNGWGPSGAAVLADNSFLSQSDNNGTIARSPDGVTWTNLAMKLVTPPIPPWTTAAGSTAKTDAGSDMVVQDPTSPARWFMTGGLAPVITTNSGATWKYPPNINGLAGVMTYKVHFPRSASSPAIIPCSDQGGFTVTDSGLSGGVATCIRATVNQQQTYHDIMASDNGQTLVAAGTDQTLNNTFLARSTNGGVLWTQLALGSGLPASYEGVNRAVAAPGNINDFLVLLGYDSSQANNNPGLYRTTNGGVSFTQATGIPAGVDTGMRYHEENAWLETDNVNTNTRYLVLRADNNAAARGFYRSTNGGSSWALTSGQPYGAQSWIDCMAVDRATAGRVWVASGSQGIARSDDGGNTWNAVGSFTGAIRIDAANGQVAVYGQLSGDTWNKVYYSADNGTNWSEKSGPQHRFNYLSDLAIDPNRAGQIWISGISVNVINPPASTTAATTTALGSSLNPSASGSNVTFTATIQTNGVTATAVTGNVTFYDSATTLGTGTVSGGVATYSTSALTIGSHPITAVYGGDPNYFGSTSIVLTQTVNAGSLTTITTLASSQNPSTNGNGVTFTATVSPSAATGTVTFKDGTTTLGTGPVSGGVATYSTSALTVGTHSITAVYGGDASYAGSTSSILTQTVNGVAQSNLALSGSGWVWRSTSATDNASKAALPAVNDGNTNVDFYFNGGNDEPANYYEMAGVTWAAAQSGIVRVVWVNGSYYIQAGWPGGNGPFEANFGLQATTDGTTWTAVTGWSVTPAYAYDSATTSGASYSFTGPALNGVLGVRIVGQVNTSPSGSWQAAGREVQVFPKTATTTALASSQNPSTNGNAVTFTATVSPGAATGTVTFNDGVTFLGTGTVSGGVAAYTNNSLTVGSHSITAVYGGDANYAGSTSSVLNQTVNPVVVATPPVQSIALSGGNVVIDWPTNATGFTLKSNGNLTAPLGSWGTVGVGAVVGTNYELSVPASAGSTFFRLVK